MPDNPKGIVALLSSPEGHVQATAVDFEPDGYGGYSLHDAQEFRCRRKLARDLFENLCHPDIAKAMMPHDQQGVVERLVREHGYRLTYIPIGHDDD